MLNHVEPQRTAGVATGWHGPSPKPGRRLFAPIKALWLTSFLVTSVDNHQNWMRFSDLTTKNRAF